MFRKAGVVKSRLFACLREFLKCLFQGAEIIVAQERPQPFKFIFRQFINPHLQKAFYDCIIKSFPQGMRRISSYHFIRGNVFDNNASGRDNRPSPMEIPGRITLRMPIQTPSPIRVSPFCRYERRTSSRKG